MDPSVGTSEIVESGEESNLGNHSNRTKPERIKLREYEGKFHGFPIKNDFSRLMESVDLQKLPRILVASHQFAIEKLRDDAFKKPSRVGSLQESGFGNPEAVNLKQALRKLCISQASEQAAMRRTSKPAGLSCTSEAATISRLFASLIDEGNKADFSVVKGKRKVGVPIKRANIASNASQKTTQVCDLCSAELSSMKVVSSPQTVATASNATKVRMKDVIVQSKIASSMHIVASTSKTTKTRIQDVIATTPAKSMDHAWLSTELRTKRNPNVIAYNPNTEMDTEQSKTCRSPRLTKPTFRSNLSFSKKGMQKSAASSRISDRFIEAEECVNSPTGANLVCRETAPPKPGTMLSSDTVGRKSINCVTDECECDQNDSSSGKSTIARINKTSRSREKGDCSQSSVSSLGDYSSSTSFSSESYQSGSSYNAVRPHMSKDEKWVAVRHALNQHGNLCLMNFKLIRKLGCGDIGTVYLAELIGSGCLFALKVIDVEFLLSRKKMLRAQCEREILQLLDHPFLPTLYAHFTEDNLSCLLMEYCPGGDLHVQRQKQPGRRFSESAARFYVAEVLLALEYLHMLGVIYRDLKPENILVREDGHIMLSDFDLSLRCTSSPTLIGSSSLDREEAPRKISGPCSECSCINPYCLHPSMSQISCFTPRLLPSSMTKNGKIRSELVVEPTNARSNSYVGTHEYLAPEIIKGEGHGSSVDWWTFGIFLYELLYGRTPFKGPGNEETLINVVLQGLKFPETPTVSFHAMDLIKGLLVKDPESRLGSVKGAAEIKRHPFFDGLNWALIRCALPPEIPGSFKPGTPMSTSKEKEGECLDFGRNDDDIEIELF